MRDVEDLSIRDGVSLETVPVDLISLREILRLSTLVCTAVASARDQMQERKDYEKFVDSCFMGTRSM